MRKVSIPGQISDTEIALINRNLREMFPNAYKKKKDVDGTDTGESE